MIETIVEVLLTLVVSECYLDFAEYLKPFRQLVFRVHTHKY
jgi:hypothetical protein